MAREDGGAAFPAFPAGHTGMTLRDWFAGQAILTAAVSIGDPNNPQLHINPAALAALTYEIADALLAVRNKEG